MDFEKLNESLADNLDGRKDLYEKEKICNEHYLKDIVSVGVLTLATR